MGGFEFLMLCCFGFSWPFAIAKSLKSSSTKGKRLMFMALVSAMFAFSTSFGAESLPPAVHDRGGVTFDFAECSRRRFDALFSPEGDILRKSVAGSLPYGAKRTEWNSIEYFGLPVATGQTYRVFMHYRKDPHIGTGAPTYFHLRPWKWDAALKRHVTVDDYATDKAYQMVATGGGWSVVGGTVTIPHGATTLIVSIRRADKDDAPIEYRDLAIVPVRQGAPLDVDVMAAGRLDGRFVLGENQSGEIEFPIRRSGEGQFDIGDLRFCYDIPAGVEFVDATFIRPGTLKKSRGADGSSSVSFVPQGVSLTKRFQDTTMPAILLRATGRRGVCGPLRLRVDCKATSGTEFSYEVPPVMMEIGPAVKAKAVPKRYLNGVSYCMGMRNMGDEGLEAFSRTMIDAGVTWMVSCQTPRRIYDFWRRNGVLRITPYAETFCNGFAISPPGGLPEADRWVPGNIKETDGFYGYLRKAACPVSVYGGGETFRTKIAPHIREFAAGADGVWSNWEPFMFRARGCFCDKCCHAFAEWIGRPYEEVAKTWPGCVMKGGAWFDRVQKFRSLEHAKVVKAIDRVVREATGGEKSVGFIPGICWIEMGSWWRPRNYAAEVQAIDYADALRWMNPWGPYPWWKTDDPYVYAKRGPLCYFFAAKDVRETVDRDYPAGSRPKLMALPHGFQNFSCVTQPEYISMAMDSFFFNGWEATVEYFFPRGYDSRYWARFAEATERAAKYEDIVHFGRRADDRVELEPVSGLYASPVRYLSGYLPATTNVSPLQAAAYFWNDRSVVAAFNFWEKGEAFFRMKVSGLEPEAGYVVVSDDGVLRAKDAEHPAWSGAELAKGVLMSVGAARCRAFEIVPASAKTAPTSILTDAELEKVIESRREALELEVKKDLEYERGSKSRKGTSSDLDAAVI